MNPITRHLFLSLAASLAPTSAIAHHGWGGYDTSKSFTITQRLIRDLVGDGGRHAPHSLRHLRSPALFLRHAEVAMADDAANAWKALQAGGHVALMRHADAPGGFGDPPGFRVDDCATQRNLSDKGRADAAKIGARLHREGIAFEKILSSPWCRCIDTAALLNLGTAETEATFGNVVVLRDQRDDAHRRRPRAHRQMEGASKPARRDARREHCWR